MNSLAIADAIAARFAGITATFDGQTEALTEGGPTARLPDTVSTGPTLLVYHPTGNLLVDFGATNRDELDFPVRLLRDPLEYPARSAWLYAWYDAMRLRVEGDMDLNLPTVVEQAEATSVRIELDGEEYAGVLFDVVELVVHVQLHEVGVTIGV